MQKKWFFLFFTPAFFFFFSKKKSGKWSKKEVKKVYQRFWFFCSAFFTCCQDKVQLPQSRRHAGKKKAARLPAASCQLDFVLPAGSWQDKVQLAAGGQKQKYIPKKQTNCILYCITFCFFFHFFPQFDILFFLHRISFFAKKKSCAKKKQRAALHFF